jgi:hypothetical protein
MSRKKYYEESIFCEEPDLLQTKFLAENILCQEKYSEENIFCEEPDSLQKKSLLENILCQEKNILRKILFVKSQIYRKRNS